MKKLLKKILFAALAVTTLSVCAVAEQDIHADGVIPDEHNPVVNEANNEEISIAVMGNSILGHGKAEGIGWYGEGWGMAASGPDKDYISQLKGYVKDMGFTNVKWSTVSLATLERTIDKRMDYKYESEIKSYVAPTIDRAQPDIVIFQIGENVSGGPTRESYAHALTLMAEYCKSVNPDVEIIFCKPFWGGDAKVAGVEIASKNTGFTYADLAQFNTNENKAIGLFEHSGVAAHPGDLGMANIAKEIFSQLKIVLNKKYINKEQVEVKLDGKYMIFDVPAQIINGRTMVPVRAISEAFGAEVDWVEETKTVIIDAPSAYITMVLGENFFTKNGKKIELDVPATEVNWRTLVPIRAISEALDCDVKWDEAKWTAIITKPEEVKTASPKELKADNCNTLSNSGFFSSNADLEVVSDEGSVNKYINVKSKMGATQSWTYIWSKMSLIPGATYVIEAEVKLLDKDGAGNAVEKSSIGGCLHFNGKDNGLGTKDISVSDGWVKMTFEGKVPEDFVRNPDDDQVGIYVNPVNKIGASFAIDNISVTVKGGVPEEVEEVATESVELKADMFVAGNGFNVKGKDNAELSADDRKVTVEKTDAGITVSHGGYYNNGENWGGVALKNAEKLDGMSVTIKFDKVPEVKAGHDCWISVDFLKKPELFKVGNVSGNPGFMNLIRFSHQKWELYEGITKFGGIKNIESATDMFSVKSGDEITVSARLVDGFYEFTYVKGDDKASYKYESEEFTKLFDDGKAHLVIGASCDGTGKDAFKYTITNLSYAK